MGDSQEVSKGEVWERQSDPLEKVSFFGLQFPESPSQGGRCPCCDRDVTRQNSNVHLTARALIAFAQGKPVNMTCQQNTKLMDSTVPSHNSCN